MVATDLGVDLGNLKTSEACPDSEGTAPEATGSSNIFSNVLGEDAPSWALPVAIAAAGAAAAFVVSKVAKG